MKADTQSTPTSYTPTIVEVKGEVYAQLFIVVCTGFHTAYGPFLTADAALEAAHEPSADGCAFVPVPLLVSGFQSVAEIAESQSPSSTVRGYL
jgi:hypothetical protein